MLDEQSARNDEPIGNGASLREGDTPAEHTIKAEVTNVSKASASRKHAPELKRRLIIGVSGVSVLVAILIFGVPWIRLTLNTVSTDDSYVNGHVTFVAARVGGQVARVLVDDNNRVHKGDVLVELDKEPLRDVVAVKKAAVDTANAELQVAIVSVQGIEAQARSLFWQL